jgi:ribosomal protein S16
MFNMPLERRKNMIELGLAIVSIMLVGFAIYSALEAIRIRRRIMTEIPEPPPDGQSSRWSDEPERALYESFKRLVELGNGWNKINDYLVVAAMAEKEKDSDAAQLIGRYPSALKDRKESIVKDLKENLKKPLKKQGKSGAKITDVIEEFDRLVGNLKTAEQRRELLEKFPLNTESVRKHQTPSPKPGARTR